MGKNKYATVKDLTKKVVKETGLDEQLAKQTITLYFEEIKRGVAEGKRVRLPGFGYFQITKWKTSLCYDPNTKLKVPRNVTSVKFKPSVKLREQIRSN